MADAQKPNVAKLGQPHGTIQGAAPMKATGGGGGDQGAVIKEPAAHGSSASKGAGTGASSRPSFKKEFDQACRKGDVSTLNELLACAKYEDGESVCQVLLALLRSEKDGEFAAVFSACEGRKLPAADSALLASVAFEAIKTQHDSLAAHLVKGAAYDAQAFAVGLDACTVAHNAAQAKGAGDDTELLQRIDFFVAEHMKDVEIVLAKHMQDAQERALAT